MRVKGYWLKDGGNFDRPLAADNPSALFDTQSCRIACSLRFLQIDHAPSDTPPWGGPGTSMRYKGRSTAPPPLREGFVPHDEDLARSMGV